MPRSSFLAIAALGLLTAGSVRPAPAVPFERPSDYERRRALGNLFELPEAVRPWFAPNDDFPPITIPQSGDWLAAHRESGQAFEDWRDAAPHLPDTTRRVIYLQPLGEFPDDTAEILPELRDFAAAFFQMEVRILPPYLVHELEFSPRRNRHGGQRQLLTKDIMDFLRDRLPADAYCLLGVTMADLYPEPSWNFVFGEASLDARVGVHSLARYDPSFAGEVANEQTRDLVRQRACKVLAHETAHMFGMQHCIYFDCVVNGANHLEESDAHPAHFCPLCLRKLFAAVQFDPGRRYRDLAAFFRHQKWWDELDWTNRQLAKVLPATRPTNLPDDR